MKKFGFLRHHRKIRIEGINFSNVVNKCIKNNIVLKDIRWHDPLESSATVKNDDFEYLRKLTGHSYRMSTISEGGIIPLFRSMKSNIITIIGAFLLGALIFYQSLFVAEIRVDGYISITETQLRQTLAEAGLYEGVRKPDDYDDIKAAIYENHESVTWASIFEDGRLIKVTVAEAGKANEAKPEDETPVNIVAGRSGMIEKITPLQGNAKVQAGDYVNKGDVLISGRFRYQSTDYSRGDDFFTMYSHAKGQALAKVPRQVTFYMEKCRRSEVLTGRFIPGIYIKIGDIQLDTARRLNNYEASVRKENVLIDTVRPLPVKLSFVRVKETELTEKRQDKDKIQSVVEAAIRQYAREELNDGEEITSFDIDYSESEQLIRADVLMEVLEDIGEEKEIKVKDK